MNEAQIRKLLSEYAAGSISDADRRILFKEALENQSIFESLVATQPLAELMSDEAARSELRAALEPGGYGGLLGWLRRPWPIAAAATVAVVLLAVFVSHRMEQPAQISETRVLRESQQVVPSSPPRPPEIDEAGVDAAESKVTSPAREAALPSLQAKREEALPKAPLPASPVLAGRLAESPRNEMISPKPEEELRDEVRAAPASAAMEGAGVKPSGGVNAEVDRSAEVRKSTAEVGAVTNLALRTGARDQEQSRTSVGPSIRYQFLRRGQDGRLDAAPANTVFNAGDDVHLQLVPEDAGYLAVAEQGADGAWRILFPAEGDRAIRVTAHATVLVPPSGTLEVGPSATERRLLVVFTTEPQGALLSPGGVRRPDGGTVLEIVLRAGR